MLGTMETMPRLQARGGKWLPQRVLADCAGRRPRLGAIRSECRLYGEGGCLPVGAIGQQQRSAPRMRPA